MPINPDNPFKGRQHPGELIILCVRLYLRYPVVRKNNTALRISRIRAIGSDVRLTLRGGRIVDVTSAEARRNNVTYLFGNSLILQRMDLLRSTVPILASRHDKSPLFAIRSVDFSCFSIAAGEYSPNI